MYLCIVNRKHLRRIKIIFWTLSCLIIDKTATFFSKLILYKQNKLKLVILRTDLLGDYILFRNFFTILKKSKNYSNYDFTLIGNSNYAELAEELELGIIDHFIWVDFKKFNNNLFYRFKTIRIISSKYYETFINPIYSRTFLNDQISKYLKAENKIGINICQSTNINKKQAKITNSYYSKIIDTSDLNLFEFERNKNFISQLIDENINLTKPFIATNSCGFDKYPTNSKYIIIVLGASHEKRRWSAKKFADAINEVDEKTQISIVLIGSSAESSLADDFITAVKPSINMINLIGKTDLISLIRIISQAELVLSNETGIVHLAVALDKKIVCVSNGNHLGRFSPYPEKMYSEIIYVYHHDIDPSLAYSNKNEFQHGSSLDINEIEVNQVVKAVDKLIAS